MDVRVGLWRKVSAKELMVLNFQTLESRLDCNETQSVHPKGNQSWIVTGRIDVEAEAPVLWSPDAKNWLTGKDPDAGKDWRQEEKGTTEDEMVGWHHRYPSYQWTWVWVSSGSWWWTGKSGVLQSKELDTTEWLNWDTKISCLFPGQVKNYSKP